MEFITYNRHFEKETIFMINDFFGYHANLVHSTGVSLSDSAGLEIIADWTSENHELYLIKVNYKLIGFCHLWYKGDIVCWIEDLYIVPSERGKGYGTHCLQLAEDIVKLKPGYQALSLDVVTRNKTAIDLYYKNGFDSISLITLRKEFGENKRDQSVSFLGHDFKY